MSFQIICVLSLLVAGALAQSDLGATAGEYVPTNEALIYEAGGEKSWNQNFDSVMSWPSYYFYSVPSAGALTEQELRYVAWAGYNPSSSGFPNNGNHYEYVVGWTPHCVAGTGPHGGSTCGFAGYQIDASKLPTTWSELRITKPRNFETTFHVPVSVDVGNEIAWHGRNDANGRFIVGSPDFWYTLWYVDSQGKAYQMQCQSDLNGGSGDQFVAPTSSAPGTTDAFATCTDASSGGNAWVAATIPYPSSDAGAYSLWHVSSGGRQPGDTTYPNTQGGCNVAFIDNAGGSSSFSDANSNTIKKGRIWWGAWSGTSSSSACSGGFVPIGGSSPDSGFISVGNGFDNIWAIQDNGDGTTSLRFTPIIGVNSLPSFSRTTPPPGIAPQYWHDGGWTASTKPIHVDSYDCARTYVIDNAFGLWRVSADSSSGSCVVSGWTQIINATTDNVKALDISVGPVSAFVTLVTTSGEKQFRLDH